MTRHINTRRISLSQAMVYLTEITLQNLEMGRKKVEGITGSTDFLQSTSITDPWRTQNLLFMDLLESNHSGAKFGLLD